jgi:hypothetical protein
MVTTHNFEDYETEVDANGDLILYDSNGNEVRRIDDTTGEVSYSQPVGSGDYQEEVNADGDLVLKDPNGNVVRRYDLAEGQWVYPAVSTENADVTGETYIEAERTQSLQSITAGSFTNIVDTENEDSLGEFNSSQQFSPTETGKYIITGYGRIGVGNSGDSCHGRIRNVTDGTTTRFLMDTQQSGGTGVHTVTFTTNITLDSAKNYEFQVTDNDSTYDMKKFSFLEIKRSVVHP